MKKIAIILIIITLLLTNFSSIVLANELTNKEVNKRMLVYMDKKKDPLVASGLSLAVPTAGHYYAGHWLRGAGFAIGQAILTASSIDYNYEYNSNTGQYETQVDKINPGAALGAIGLKFWEMYDAYKLSEDYNTKLKHNLKLTPKFGVKDGQLRGGVNYSF